MSRLNVTRICKENQVVIEELNKCLERSVVHASDAQMKLRAEMKDIQAELENLQRKLVSTCNASSAPVWSPSSSSSLSPGTGATSPLLVASDVKLVLQDLASHPARPLKEMTSRLRGEVKDRTDYTQVRNWVGSHLFEYVDVKRMHDDAVTLLWSELTQRMMSTA